MRRLFQTNRIFGSSLPGKFIARHVLRQEVLPVGVPPGYTRRWIHGIPGPLPSWEGVTPGQTTVEEAIKIWNDNPAIIKGSVVSHIFPDDNTAHVVWKWVGSKRGGEALYKLDVLPHTICLIRPFFEYLSWSSRYFRLDEVMSVYGEPSHVVARCTTGFHGEGWAYGIDIVYALQGVIFEGGSRNRRRYPQLHPKMLLSRVFFEPLPYDPGDTRKSRGTVYIVRPWQGFKNFEEYLKD